MSRCVLALTALLTLSTALHAEVPSRPPLDRPTQDDWCELNGVMEPTWSPDGTRIAAVVWWIHVPSFFLETALSIFAPEGGGDGGCFLLTGWSRPAWSPDGHEIAFSDFGGWIYSTSADTCDWPDFRLVSASNRATDLAWSPDGSRIAFTDRTGISTVAAAGGGPQPVARGKHPAWSPDGRFIAFASDQDGSFDIWIAPANGHDALQLTHGPSNDSWPTWSPDGRFIAFASDRTGDSHIWAVPADGGEPVQLTQGAANETAPAWSPRGDRIAFLATEGACSWIGIESNLHVTNVQPRSWSAVKSLFR